MTYFHTVIVCCFLCVATMVTARGDDEPQRPRVAACPVSITEAGRYMMARFQDTLVLLDRRTGQTWLLTKRNGESATWVLIAGAVPGKVKLESPSSTIGETQIQFIPEMSGPIIIGRSKNKDAATTDTQRGDANGAYRSYDGQTKPSKDRRTKR